MHPLTLTLDGKNRISLTKLLKGIKASTFNAFVNKKGNIELTPMMLIPESEAWFYQNAARVKSMDKSFEEASRGDVSEIEL